MFSAIVIFNVNFADKFTFGFLFLRFDYFGFGHGNIFGGFSRTGEFGCRYFFFLAILGGVSLKITLRSASIDASGGVSGAVLGAGWGGRRWSGVVNVVA